MTLNDFLFFFLNLYNSYKLCHEKTWAAGYVIDCLPKTFMGPWLQTNRRNKLADWYFHLSEKPNDRFSCETAYIFKLAQCSCSACTAVLLDSSNSIIMRFWCNNNNKVQFRTFITNILQLTRYWHSQKHKYMNCITCRRSQKTTDCTVAPRICNLCICDQQRHSKLFWKLFYIPSTQKLFYNLTLMLLLNPLLGASVN